MLRIKVICVGKLKERFYHDAADEYAKRLYRYCNIEITELSEARISDNPSNAQIEDALFKEAAAIKKSIQSAALIVALCVEGKQIDSPALSELIKSTAAGGTPRLNFIIGGSMGLHNNIKSNADMLISMSKMTFPHHLARIMLLEQLYRAFNIINCGKYHK